MGTKRKTSEQMKMYVKWPLLLSIYVVAASAVICLIHIKAGIAMLGFSMIYILITLYIYVHNRAAMTNELISFAARYGQVQKQLLRDLELPYALLDENGKVLWTNSMFEQIIHKEKGYRKSITSVLPDIRRESMPDLDEESTLNFTFEERDYRALMKKVYMFDIVEAAMMFDEKDTDEYLIALFLYDETELNFYIRENEEQRMVAGLIYLDNYEEALESIEEVRRSLLTALIDRKINKYITAQDGLVKKIEKDKYLVLMKNKSLQVLQEDRFALLEDVKTVNIGNEMAVTLSIGIGMGADSYLQNYEYARAAIDLALGRGGDQAVVKSEDDIIYYGGKSQKMEKNTRVKARVKAHALKEIIETHDRMIVMGHKISDVDTFGAAIGMYRASKTFDKRCHIIINDITTSIRPLIDGFLHNPDYEEDMFVNNSGAMELVDSNTALIVVDVNKPSFTECPELLERCSTIVVLDHHRQGAEKIENATLSYIEPYASSACEMVAEIMQYISDGIKIRGSEADTLYAGIVIDTNNFLTKTGVRTFEAAAFLRRNGADVTRVRKIFRDEIVDYKARAEAVRSAEIYRHAYAIAVCPAENLDSPTIVGAQAANELLNINGVKASFVMTEYQNKIYISARSIDEVNVQIIMERLGGGGHMNIAGAQVQELNVDEVSSLVKRTLDEMLAGGEI